MHVQTHAALAYTQVLSSPDTPIFRYIQKWSMFNQSTSIWKLHVFICGEFVLCFSDIRGFYEINDLWEGSLFFIFNRMVVLKDVLYLSACQQWLGQACDLWPLTVKLTLPPVGCCAKCQERPLILSRCLVGHSAADYLSCPDQCTYIPRSAQICCRLSCTETGPLEYSIVQRRFLLFFFSYSNKMMQ